MWLVVVVMLVGLVLLIVGVRGRRVGQELRCPKCEFDITTHFAAHGAVTCPECGETLREKSLALRGSKRRRPAIITLSSLLLLFTVPGLGLIILQNRSTPWLQARKSADLLVWEWFNLPKQMRLAAGDELLRRHHANIDVNPQIAKIGTAILPTYVGKWWLDPTAEQLFDIAYSNDLLPRDQVIDVAFSKYGVRVETPPALRQFTTLPVAVVDGFIHSDPFDNNKRAQFARSQILVSIEDEQGNVVGHLIIDDALESQFENASTWRRDLQPKTLPDLPVGTYRLCGEARSYYFAPWTNVTPVIARRTLLNEHQLIAGDVPSRTFPIEVPFRIVDETETLVSLNMDDTANARMTQTLQQATVTLSPNRWGKSLSIYIFLDPKLPRLKENGVYTVRVEQGECVAHFPADNRSGPGAEAWSTKVPSHEELFRPPIGFGLSTDQPFKPGSIRVTFTPDIRAAERLVGPYAVQRILGKPVTIELEMQERPN